MDEQRKRHLLWWCSHTHTLTQHIERDRRTTFGSSLLPAGESQGTNSGHQPWQQVPVPAEPSHCPLPHPLPKSPFHAMLRNISRETPSYGENLETPKQTEYCFCLIRIVLIYFPVLKKKERNRRGKKQMPVPLHPALGLDIPESSLQCSLQRQK